MDTHLLFNGEFAAGTEAAETILNPRTGETVLELPEASAEQIDAAARGAREAFETWSRTTPSERSAALLRIAERIEAEAEDFGRLEALNCGKPINAAIGDEIPAIVDCYRFFAGAVRTLHDPVAVNTWRATPPWSVAIRWGRGLYRALELSPDDDGLEARARHRGGNTVVFKPSEQTPLTALKLARILAEELPRGIVNVLTGRGETVGNALIHHDAIDMISLTGEVATGKKMLQAASKSVKRTHLELGDKAPVIVFDDADIVSTSIETGL